MRIYNNVPAFSSWVDYTNHWQKLRDSMQRLSSGVILTTDNPAGIGISERLRAQAMSVESSRSNADDGISMMQTADSWLEKINELLSDMQTIIVDSGPLTDTDITEIAAFQAYQDEIIGITSQYDAVGKYNGLYLFRGGNGTTGYQDSVLTTGGRSAQAVGRQQAVVSGSDSSEIVALAGGGYVVANSLIDGASEGVQLYSGSGVAIGGVGLSVADTSNIVALSKGGFLTYTDGTVQEYDRYGNSVGSSKVISATEDIQSIVSRANGDYVSVVGQGASESVVYFDVALSSSSTVNIASPDDAAEAKVAVYESGEFLVADGAGITKYDSNGVAVTSGFSAVTASGTVEDIVTLKDGSFVVQTGTGSSAEFQRYYSSGSKYGDVITVDENVADVKALDDGGFIIVATDDVGGGSDNVLNLHRYSSDNSAFEEIKVSTGRNTVSDIDVLVLESGDIVAEWGENGSSYTRQYDLGAGVTAQVGPDQGQDMVIGLPDLQQNNYQVIGSYNDGSDDHDIRWSDILDTSSMATQADAIAILDVAMEYVSGQRVLVASQQNVMQFRKEGLLTYQDNLEAAEGRIRNVDMAQESIEFTQRQILFDSASAMIAQANAMAPDILDLIG